MKRLTVKSASLDGAMAPKTLDRERRTVEVIFSTGAPVLRTAWDGSVYKESLSMKKEDVNLDRMRSGAPVLDSHMANDLSNVIGVVEHAEIRDGVGYARIRFAEDAKSEEIFKKVASGIVRNTSIGYKPTKMVDVTRSEDTYPHYLVKNYEIFELSLVGVPADSQAQVRTNNKVSPVEVELLAGEELNVVDRQRILNMPDNNNSSAQAAVLAERERVTQIKLAVRSAGLDEKMADEYIERGTTLAEAKQNIEMFARYQQEQNATRISSTTRVELGQDQQDKRRQGFQDALAHKMDHTLPVTEAAKPFQYQDLLRMVETYLGGRRMSESNYQLATRAMSTSDFPLILANAASKVAQARYELAPKSYLEWSSIGKPLKDFKSASLLRAGDHGSLVEKLEGGEYKRSSFSSEKESVSLKTYGNIHAFTREALQNDDLSMLSQVASEGAVASARLEESLVYDQLISNPTMGDGVALFHASHANLGTGAAISANSIGEAMKLMRKQTSVDGRDVLNIPPAFMIVGPDSEQLARQYLSAINPAQASDVNPWASSLKLVISGQISGNDYYFAASPAAIPTVQRFYLEGASSPSFESKVDFNTDSVLLKVRFDVAAAAVDWRGLVYNANAS